MSRPAAIQQAAILVGGRGTRLGGITATTPKPILPVGGRPFLAWLMRELVRFGVTDFLLLTGHLSERIEASVAGIVAGLPKPVSVVFSAEPAEAGTGGALHCAAGLLHERFLLCNGDSLFDCNLATLLAAAARDDGAIVGRMVLRELADASRFGVVELQGDRVTSFRERPPEAGASVAAVAGVINAGIYLFDRRILARLRPNCSLERDVLPELAADSLLRGTVGTGYFRDIGVPHDLAAAQAELPARLHRPALFLDRDGVLNVDHGWVGSRDRFEWTVGAREAVRLATDAGWHVFLVTNQSGVARGLYDEAAVLALHGWMAEEVLRAGGTIDDSRYCPYHPQASIAAYCRDSSWRKPAPGMLLDLMRAWELSASTCVMVGDQPTDMAAAAAAGMAGHLFAGGDLEAFVARLIA